MKKVLIGIFTGVLLISGGYYFYNLNSSKDTSKVLDDSNKSDIYSGLVEEKFSLDINGDGEKEEVINYVNKAKYYDVEEFLSEEELNAVGYIVAYDKNGNELGRTPEWFGSPPHAYHMDASQLNKSSRKEYLRMDVIAGAHSFETMFLELRDDVIYPVCSVKDPKEVDDCLFYSSVGGVIVEDLNNDGLMEVIERVDEYTSGSEERRVVVWNIFSFNGTNFDRQVGSDYDELFNLFCGEECAELKREELSSSSEKHVESVRDFWTHRE